MESSEAPVDMHTGGTKSFKDALDSQPVVSGLDIDTELEPMEGAVTSEMTERGPVIRLSARFRERIHQQWADTVIVKLWGRPMGYKLLCNRLQRLWGLRGGFRVLDLDLNYYLVRLADNYDYIRALTGGPWVILDHYLTVEPWQPNFEPASHKVTSVVAWVRVPGLSSELYQLAIMREVCNRVGHFIRVDYSTQKAERGRFAKAAVELDLSQPLQTETCVDGVWYPIMYENLPQRQQFKKGGSGSSAGRKDGTQGTGSGSCFGVLADDSVDTPEPEVVTADGGLMQGQKTTASNAKGGNHLDVAGLSSVKGKAKGVFSGTKVPVMQTKELPALKLSRGDSRYVLSEEDLMATALDAPRRIPRTKKGSTKVDHTIALNDPKWSKLVLPEVPIPSTFQVSLEKPKQTPVLSTFQVPLEKPKENLVVAPVSGPVGLLDPGDPPIGTGLAVAFDPRGQGHSDSSVPEVTTRSSTLMASVEDLIQMDASGAGGEKFSRAFRDLVFTHRPSLVVLVETKVRFEVASGVIRSCGFDASVVSEVAGRSGGIWVCWRQHVAWVSVLVTRAQFVHVRVQLSGEDPWILTAVYASPTPSLRQSLWQETRSLAERMCEPWLLIGDFNTYVDQSEKLGGLPTCMRMCARFSSWIHDCKLVDLGFHGPMFTWECRVGVARELVAERLDRGLVNQQWRIRYPDAELWHLPRTKSDHSPLLLHLHAHVATGRPKPFRFQAAWLLDSRFQQVVVGSWRGDLLLPDATVCLQRDLARWNREVFGNIFRRKKELLARIGGIQLAKAEGRAGPFLFQLETELVMEYDIVLTQEEVLRYQKSRSQWVQNGDRNTSIFHASTIIRRHRNKRARGFLSFASAG
ncbi:hypothetical protein Tsubulata_001385 [Turnera subulata]|uniref:DUF4283 domain-containing protein n=1 Tax=Turnera subulata TaxID=218843 RepID=A0A9Q0FJH9_9ROSI|nr:hypothetical protein Tsubulata_001385 [Turnera subulata]